MLDWHERLLGPAAVVGTLRCSAVDSLQAGPCAPHHPILQHPEHPMNPHTLFPTPRTLPLSDLQAAGRGRVKPVGGPGRAGPRHSHSLCRRCASQRGHAWCGLMQARHPVWPHASVQQTSAESLACVPVLSTYSGIPPTTFPGSFVCPAPDGAGTQFVSSVVMQLLGGSFEFLDFGPTAQGAAQLKMSPALTTGHLYPQLAHKRIRRRRSAGCTRMAMSTGMSR